MDTRSQHDVATISGPRQKSLPWIMGLRDVTIDRAEIGALCVRMDCIAERLARRVKNARAMSHLTVSVTADELETISKDLASMSELAKKAHGILRTEEIRTRSSEPIPING